jgi:DNA-binding NarL/FixJ family response regulator
VQLNNGSQVQSGDYFLHIWFTLHTAIESDLNPDAATRSNSFDVKRRGSIIDELTSVQRRVLLGFANGFSEKEIAREHGLNVHTIHAHVKTIYRVLGVSSRGELLKIWAARK